MSAYRIVIGSLSVLAGGALGTALIYFYTKENMWEGGRDNFLPLSASEQDWELVFDYFNANKSNKSITDEELKKLDSKEKLKNWCSKKYKETFSSLFHMTNWMQLSEMKKACLLPIKKKLENNKLVENKEGININKLKNHSDSNGYKLTYILEGIKKETNAEELLFKWCQAMADHGYQREDSNTYKLVKGLCLKDK